MISYSQCWEDAEVVLNALRPTEKDTILSVTSGGCNTLAIAAWGAKLVYSVDRKVEQNHLLELKRCAIKNLDYAQTIDLLGYNHSSRRVELYNRISVNLPSVTKKYWDNNLNAIRRGVVHCGKFEKYLRTFRNIALPLVHNKKRINLLLNPSSKKDQVDFYQNHWCSSRWKLLFRVFFSRWVMSRSGRSPEMFAHSQNIDTSQQFFSRTENALMFGPVKDNFYLSYLLLGKGSKLQPLFLLEENFTSIKLLDNIEIISDDVLTVLRSFPDSSISKFNLSDIFEPINQATANMIFYEVIRTATPGARIIFWNNLVARDVPGFLRHRFIDDADTENELQKIDKIFFYEKFYIYTILK